MRVSINIPPETWEQISLIGDAEHRPPKNQAEHMLIEIARERAAQYDQEFDESDEPRLEVTHYA
jgi:hypothetical protein